MSRECPAPEIRLQILHNFVHDLEGTEDIGDSHVDCMQTFATSGPGSSDVVIQGNRCEGIRAQCLMAEGPDVEDGSGEGVSRGWLFDGNYCDAHAAAQSVSLVDIQNVTISRTPRARSCGTTGSDRVRVEVGSTIPRHETATPGPAR